MPTTTADSRHERCVKKITQRYGVDPLECIPKQYRPEKISGEFVSRMEAILKHVPTLQLFQALLTNTVELRLADKLDNHASFKFATARDPDSILLSLYQSNPAAFRNNRGLERAKRRQHHYEKAGEPPKGAEEEESSGSQSMSREAAHAATRRESNEGGGDGYHASSRKIDEDYDDEEDNEWMPEELKGVSAANMQALLHDGNVEGLLK